MKMKNAYGMFAAVLTSVACVWTPAANAVDSIDVGGVSVASGGMAPAMPALVSTRFTAPLGTNEIGVASTNYVVKWSIANVADSSPDVFYTVGSNTLWYAFPTTGTNVVDVQVRSGDVRTEGDLTWVASADSAVGGHWKEAEELAWGAASRIYVNVTNAAVGVGSVVVGDRKWSYQTYANGTAEITGVSPDVGAIDIPSSIGGYVVTSIRDSAFYSKQQLTSVVIPNGVTNIGAKAFYNCRSLSSLVIPDSVKGIGKEAFQNCSGLLSATLGNGLASIGDSVFESCSSLTNVVLPRGLKEIGYEAFYNCGKLPGIDFPNGITNIGVNAFYNCAELASVTFPDSLLMIDYQSFRGCKKLSSVVMPPNVTYVASHIFCDCSGLTSIEIPEGVTGVGARAFWGCDSLKTVVFPNSLKDLGAAFENCKGLVSLSIPSNVTSIADYAFSDCRNLQSLTIPDSVTSIGRYAFENCGKLQSLRIPDSVKSIGQYAFYGCGSLESAVIPEGVTSVGQGVFYACGALETVAIPDGVTSIGNSAFQGCSSLASVVIPNSVTNIGQYAFYGCASLESVVIPEGVTSIGHSTFHSCGKLASVTIPNGVTAIGESAFSRCGSLASVRIPDSVTDIGTYAFDFNTSLKSIAIPSSVAKIGYQTFNGCTNLTYVTLEEGLTSIGESMFSDCVGLTELNIPNTVTNIGHSAFSGCIGLTELKIPDGVAYIGHSAFSGCTGLTSFVIPDGVTSVADCLFYGCTGLIEVKIPESVTNIGYSAFSACGGLKSVAIPDGVEEIGYCAFTGCGLEVALLPKGLKMLWDGAFSYCTNLVSVSIFSDINQYYYGMGWGVFHGCSKLTSVAVAGGVTCIAMGMFDSCPALTSIVFPESLESIGDWAFSYCTNLTSVTFPSNVTEVGWGAFGGCSNLTNALFEGNAPIRIYEYEGYDDASFPASTVVCVYSDTTGWDVEIPGTWKGWEIRYAERPNPNLRTVTFDLGGHGVRSGGGDLVQRVLLGESAVAPTVRPLAGWVFDGWTAAFTNIADNVSVSAKYRRVYADLQVRDVVVTNAAVSGGLLNVGWTVVNAGNLAFNGEIAEKVSLVSAVDSNVVHVLGTSVFNGTIARDASVVRSLSTSVPLKGAVGDWFVRVETSIGASTTAYLTGGIATAATTLAISGVPLPNLVVAAAVTNVFLVPGSNVTVACRVQNVGGANAVAPWTNRFYLETDDASTVVQIGHSSWTNDLAAGGAVEMSSTLTIPELVPLAGSVRLRVVVNEDGDVVESDEDDNAIVVAEVLSLATNLYLSAASTSVYENVASGVRFTVRRSGPLAEPLTVALSANRPEDVALPETVTIPAESRLTTFNVKPVDNAVVDGTRNVRVSATAASCREAALDLMVLDDEVPKLKLALDRTSIREGDGVIRVTVTRELVTDEDLVVYMSNMSSGRCSYPSSVVIPAGEASATFEISVPDNDTAQAAMDLTLRASAAGHATTAASYTVEDDDVPGVTLALTPGTVSEGAGVNAIYATLTRSDTNQIDKAIRVRLTASEAGQLILPGEVTIPKYTMAVRFAVGVVDNALDDGDREVEVNGAIVIESCGCNGTPSNGDVIQAVVGIIDNDGPALTLVADPTTMREGMDPAGYLLLSHNSILTEDLTVRLWVDEEDEDEISIPETVTIRAGETSIRIPVATLDDGVEDGGQLVSVYAEVDGDAFAPASTWVQVSDQNLPDLTVAHVKTPASVVAKEAFEVSFTVTNVGFMALSRSVPYAVHLVADAAGKSVSSETLVKSGTLAGGLAVQGALSGRVSLAAPELPGDYRVAVVLDPDGAISELDSANNVAWSNPISAAAAYVATAGVDRHVCLPGETVTVTGVVTCADGQVAADVAIEVYVLVDGMRRTLSATTAADGTYAVEFAPTSGEAGDYVVGACYPGVMTSVAQDSFSVVGLKRLSTDNVIWDIALGDSATRTVTIQNRSAVPLTNVAVAFTDMPAACELVHVLADTIPANGSVTLTLTATATNVTEQVDYDSFSVRITTAEGASLNIPLYFHSQAQKAYLRATPVRIDTTMAIGHARYVDVEIMNDGKGDSGEVRIAVPSANWLKIVSAASIPNLASGESATVTLAASPTADDGLALNSPLAGGNLVANCANGSGCSVPLRFTPVSEATGSLTVDAVDNNTYYLASAPHLSNATVRVSNPYTGTTVATGVTDETGKWTGDGIPEGEYQLTVTAPSHDTYASSVTVEPGRTTRETAFLQYCVISASWEVVRTEIEDEYEIKLVMEYETQVPAPVVKTTMPEAFDELAEGECVTFTMHVENLGLIAAENVHFEPPEIPNHQFTFALNDFKLMAGEAKDVAVKFEHLAKTRMMGRSAGGTSMSIATWLMGHLVDYVCNGEKSYQSYNSFRYGKSSSGTGADSSVRTPEVPSMKLVKKPSRKNGGGVTEEETSGFKGASAQVNNTGCIVSECLTSVAACLIDITMDASLIGGCVLNIIDCRLSVNETMQTHEQIGRTIFDCGLNVAGCIPLSTAGKTILDAINCTKNIGENCLLPAYENLKSELSKKSGRMSGGVSVQEDALNTRFPLFAKGVTIAREELSSIRDWHIEPKFLRWDA